MPIVHIVLFEFQPEVNGEEVKDICARMIGLSQKCLHPKTNQQYLRSYGGGRDNSPEGQQGGFTHGFVCEFATSEDRDFYLTKDPAHIEFVKSLDGKIQNVRAIDFEPGKL